MKEVSVQMAGSNRIVKVQIDTNTTVGDILRTLGVPDYLVTVGMGRPSVDRDEKACNVVSEGRNLFVFPLAD